MVIHIRRDRKDDQIAHVVMAFRTDGKDTEVRTWDLNFDADGAGRLNLWTRALVVRRDGDGLKTEMADGDGRGFRPVY